MELVNTKIVVNEGLSLEDVLVHEGLSQYVGQEGAQAIRQETQSIRVDHYYQFCEVLVIVKRPLPSHFKEGMEILKREAIKLGKQMVERNKWDQKKLVNNAIGLTLRILK